MARKIMILVTAGLLSAMLAYPAMAAEAAGGEEKVSPFRGNIGNAFWTLLVFGLVVYVLGRYAWGPLLTALQNRERFIRDSIESARRDRQASEARLRELDERLARAREEATGIVEEGRRDAEAVKRRIEDEARKNADALIERARREIGIARDSALKDLYEQSAQLAMNMAGSMLRRQITPEDQQRLISDALSELRNKGNGSETASTEVAAR